MLVPKSDGVPAAAGLAPPNRLLAPPVFPNKDILYLMVVFMVIKYVRLDYSDE